MGCTRREFLALASMGTIAGAVGCTPTQRVPETQTGDAAPEPEVDASEFEGLALDTSAWRFDSENNVYYQLGLTYCLNPATETYESLAIFVPGAYFNAEKNGDTYTCTVNEKAVVGSFTPATAPILMPVNSGTLAAQESPTAYGYEGLAPYLGRGLRLRLCRVPRPFRRRRHRDRIERAHPRRVPLAGRGPQGGDPLPALQRGVPALRRASHLRLWVRRGRRPLRGPRRLGRLARSSSRTLPRSVPSPMTPRAPPCPMPSPAVPPGAPSPPTTWPTPPTSGARASTRADPSRADGHLDAAALARPGGCIRRLDQRDGPA